MQHSVLFCLSGLVFIVWSSASANAQKKTPPPANPVEAAAIRHSLTAEEIEAFVGQTVDLLLTDGKKVAGATITQFATSGAGDRIKLIRYTLEGSSREKRLQSVKLFRFTAEGKSYRSNYLPSIKASVLQDFEKLRDEIKQNLRGQGEYLWEKLSDEDRQKFVDEEKEFLKEVGVYFQKLPMKFYETKYFLFFTDFPPAQVAPYIAKLDKMNEVLGQAFGFGPGENVWRGKAVIVAFVNRNAFIEFEREFMEYPDTGDAQGLCHSDSTGRVLVSCYRGNNPSFFGALLVHETSHGYCHRYLSTASIPSWLNEGLAEWVATAAVPREGEMNRRRQEATLRLRQTGTLEGLLSDQVSEHWHYGAAHSIVDLLIKENPQQFRLFLNGIKQGLPWEDSLVRAYGATAPDLIRLYARSIGVQNLQP